MESAVAAIRFERRLPRRLTWIETISSKGQRRLVEADSFEYTEGTHSPKTRATLALARVAMLLSAIIINRYHFSPR